MVVVYEVDTFHLSSTKAEKLVEEVRSKLQTAYSEIDPNVRVVVFPSTSKVRQIA